MDIRLDLTGRKQLVRHVIVSSCWWSHQAGHFPGGGAARGDDPAQCTLRWGIPSTGSSSADQPPAHNAPASTDDVRAETGDDAMLRATSAKRGRWAESGLSGSALDPLVGALKEDKMDSSAPRRTAHIVATQRLAQPRSSSSSARFKMTSCRTWGADEDPLSSTASL